MTVFGTNLKKYMALKGVTQTALAKQLGMKQGSISDWFRKDIMPEAKKIGMIAEILGVTTNDLLYEVGTPRQEKQDDMVLISKEVLEAKDREIEYLRQIVELKKDNDRLKNIEVVNEGQ
ncbi:helix-turn-helix domain-containing protein [Runella sp.]|uniref:helix-turn-helix domain-containing protein n=1 Tax=Runella sp. TaxID=1960881 RepID=UPI003D10EBD4